MYQGDTGDGQRGGVLGQRGQRLQILGQRILVMSGMHVCGAVHAMSW